MDTDINILRLNIRRPFQGVERVGVQETIPLKSGVVWGGEGGRGGGAEWGGEGVGWGGHGGRL